MNKLGKFLHLFAKYLLIASVILLATCQKELSIEGMPSNNSSYTIVDSTGNCLGNTVTGKYAAGVKLDSTTTVQLTVNVITPGAYKIQSSTANGISFSASGTFTNAGIQAISLWGTGTPTSGGSFDFTISTNASCGFTITVSGPIAGEASYTLNGDPTGCLSPTINGSYVVKQALTTSNTLVLSVNVTIAGTYNIITDTLDGISFSASGKFTKTGSQTVTLTGVGTPIEPANLNFNINGDATTTCSLPLSVVNPNPLATYVLESGFGDPNPCVYTVKGAYSVNTPLTNSNTVSMRVSVIALGNFTISTDTANGMKFSLTSSFTQLGAQFVELQGVGTPRTKDSTLFLPQIIGPHPLGGQVCAFEIPVQ